MIDEQKLRELAEDATPGKTEATGNGVHVGMWCVLTTHMDPVEQRQADAKFYAAANPAAILALLDEFQTLRSERTALRVTAENAEKDAARYRWLKSQPIPAPEPGPDLSFWNAYCGEALRGEDADAAIDAAMKGES